MEKVYSEKAPKAIGPYSQAIKAGGFVFCSGQIALINSGEMAGDTIEIQTRQVLENAKNILEAAGSSLEKVVKCSVFLVDLAHFAVMNEIYAEYFKHHPARSTFQVAKLPKDALVEIECMAIS